VFSVCEADEKDELMSQQIPDFTFSELHRLLRHLRRGGTRKGACGWAGITFAELERKFARDEKFAMLVEKSEALGLAKDERRLEVKVSEGDRQALLFRMKTVYGYAYGKGPAKVGVRSDTDEQSRSCERIRQEIEALSPEERRKAVKGYREAEAACSA